MKYIRLYNSCTGEIREMHSISASVVSTMFKLISNDVQWLESQAESESDQLDVINEVRFEVPTDKRLEDWLNAEKDRKYRKRHIPCSGCGSNVHGDDFYQSHGLCQHCYF